MPLLNIGLSIYLGVLPAALSISTFTYLHNEAGSASHWLGKQVCTAALYASFEVGATAVAGKSESPQLKDTCHISEMVNRPEPLWIEPESIGRG